MICVRRARSDRLVLDLSSLRRPARRRRAGTLRGTGQNGLMAEISHVVLVQWRADVPADVKEQARASARGFVDAIPGTLSVVEGPSVSPEGLEQGFDYGLVIRFADASSSSSPTGSGLPARCRRSYRTSSALPSPRCHNT